jgi:hypothetical protein
MTVPPPEYGEEDRLRQQPARLRQQPADVPPPDRADSPEREAGQAGRQGREADYPDLEEHGAHSAGMAPDELILAALRAGAGDTAEAAVRDAHAALTEQLRMLLAGRAHGEAALTGYVASPRKWGDALRTELAAAGAAQDEGLLTSARAVMSVADAQGWQMGKYTVEADGHEPSDE